jgi:tetratricopeptide (TPR) repeat protein
MAQQQYSFKIYFSEDNIRRFHTPNSTTYDQFIKLLCKEYPLNYHPELRLQYTDSEGDNIDIGSQQEWLEMFRELGEKNLLKLRVVERKKPGEYFKDGPAPEPVRLYKTEQGEEKTIEDKNLEYLKSFIPNFLKEFFPSKSILPHNIPEFLNKCIHLLPLSNNLVDLNIDLSELYNTIHTQGLSSLENNQFERAKSLFSFLTGLRPNDPICHYNLACSESLLNENEEALNHLKKSIELGYNDFGHMSTDPDLSNLRTNLPQKFDELKPKKVEQDPVPVPEPKEVPKPEPQEVPKPEPQEVPEPEQQEVPEPEPEIVIPNLSDSMLMDPELLREGRKKWERELKILHELGFLSDSILIPLLSTNGGSVETTVSELLM